MTTEERATEDRGTDPRFRLVPTAGTHFAWLRTRLALERTLMSWIRTATALIGFGFAIVEFFAKAKPATAAPLPRFPAAPRVMGLALITAGLLALVIALWQYAVLTRHLWRAEYADIAGIGRRRHSSAFAMTIVLLAIGVFTLVMELVRQL